ncbi:hypothetical protein DdX_09204 [Ditylenchus destructor]|uniref:Uncharacterized protein n=1 Tax=Ditylenchus destructor TaxID=166010 RepID=A0AAD4N2W9_9BILA|nr:hypothetical protein DdX_09204 [Ditylenchus destructor]
MTYHVICSLAGIPMNIYVMGDLFEIIKNPNYLSIRPSGDPAYFWLGMWINNYVFLGPIPMFFLTLDRCIILRSVKLHDECRRKQITVASCVTIFVAYALTIISYLIELPLDLKSTSTCVSFTCMTPMLHGLQSYYTKFVFEAFNLILSVYFLYAMRQYKFVQAQAIMVNRIVKITVILEMIFNVIPTFTGMVFNQVVGVSLGTYIGPYVNMCFLFHAAICSVFYTKVFLFPGKKTISPFSAKIQSIQVVSSF